MSLYPGTHCLHRGEWYVRHTCMQAFLVYQVLAGGEECEPIPGEEWKTYNYTRSYVRLVYKEIGTVYNAVVTSSPCTAGSLILTQCPL